MRKVSIILLTLPDGKVVLQRRGKEAPRSPGLLGFFGGHVEEGETFDEAMIREFSEETSMDINDLDWSFAEELYFSPDVQTPVHFHIYRAEIPGMDFEVYEGDRAESYSLDEALARDDLAPSCRIVLEKTKKEL